MPNQHSFAVFQTPTCRFPRRKEAWIDATSMVISNPHSNPQCVMSCMTSACFGSPRGLLSCCKTYPGSIDTVEVCGSSPHGPTILFKQLHIRLIFLQPDVQPEVGACPKVGGAFCGF